MQRLVITLLTGVLLLAGPLAGHRASAQTPIPSLVVDAGSGKVIRTSRPIANLFAADPKVAEVRPASPTSVFVFGVGPGHTTVAAFDDGGDLIAQYDVTVNPSDYSASAASRNTAAALPPSSKLTFQTTPSGLTLSGHVATPEQAQQAVAAARAELPKDQTVENRIGVDQSVQVNLKVRFAEISREVTRQLGINWSALGTIGRIGFAAVLPGNLTATNFNTAAVGLTSINGRPANAILDLLASDNLVTILAEPNLTARSGETASFLAGGEFPVPVAEQNNVISVDFKTYGVSLTFVPTVLSGDRISMRVRPEVSQLTTIGAVSVPLTNGSTVTIPGITVQRAETTVELGSGQTFAIAGLLQKNSTSTITGLPYLGELPVLGPLFKSDSFQRDESELVILVTPYLVRPVSVASTLHTPMDDFTFPNDVDRILLMRQRGQTPSTNGEGRPLGDAGFLLN